MRDLEFRNWMTEQGKTKKVISDIISRLRRVEREIDTCDLDRAYNENRCEYLLALFKNNGKNDEMEKLDTNFPVGKYYMSTYRHAINYYIAFLDSGKLD